MYTSTLFKVSTPLRNPLPTKKSRYTGHGLWPRGTHPSRWEVCWTRTLKKAQRQTKYLISRRELLIACRREVILKHEGRGAPEQRQRSTKRQLHTTYTTHMQNTLQTTACSRICNTTPATDQHTQKIVPECSKGRHRGRREQITILHDPAYSSKSVAVGLNNENVYAGLLVTLECFRVASLPPCHAAQHTPLQTAVVTKTHNCNAT